MLELERELELELELELERRLEPRLERRLGRRLEPRLGLELDELVELGERRCFRLPVFFAARRGVGLWLSAVSLRSSEARPMLIARCSSVTMLRDDVGPSTQPLSTAAKVRAVESEPGSVWAGGAVDAAGGRTKNAPLSHARL